MFMSKLYSQNDETDILRGSRQQNFICCPTVVGRLFTEFFKNFVHGFYNSAVVPRKFLEKRE